MWQMTICFELVADVRKYGNGQTETHFISTTDNVFINVLNKNTTCSWYNTESLMNIIYIKYSLCSSWTIAMTLGQTHIKICIPTNCNTNHSPRK